METTIIIPKDEYGKIEVTWTHQGEVHSVYIEQSALADMIKKLVANDHHFLVVVR